MTINEITITAEASKAYQKYCVALTAQDLNEGDIDYLKNMAISEAVKGINELAGNIETKPEVKVNTVQPQRQPSYRTDNNYRPNQPPVQQVPVQQQPQQGYQDELKYVNNVAYKKCKNKTTGEVFFAICDHSLIGPNTPKYIKE